MLKKIILLGLTAVLMTACGSNESGGVSSSGGSGVCVDVSLENAVGLTYRYKITGYRGGKIIGSKIEAQEYESFTKTSSKIIIYDDNENITSTQEWEYSISKGLQKVTKIKVNNVSSSDYEYIYKPYYIPPMKIGKNCKGDNWENEYDPYIKIDGNQKTYAKMHFKTTIENVNVEKTVTAGTFSTIKIRTEDFNNSNDYSYHWIDIDTSFPIMVEDYENGKLISKFETLDIY